MAVWLGAGVRLLGRAGDGRFRGSVFLRGRLGLSADQDLGVELGGDRHGRWDTSAVQRALTARERDVLAAWLSVDLPQADRFRRQAEVAVVVGTCGCGCPSIDFHREPGVGMDVLANAGIRGTDDGLFLFALGDRLGGIEYVGVSGDDSAELPHPNLLSISRA
ncbi:MAG TPA: hypothetical protein VNC22_14800 [Sporichthya sp.]|nr:hypothetical protein [Sporichthya sp.]